MASYRRCPNCENTEKDTTLYKCTECGRISCHAEYFFGGSGCGRDSCPGCTVQRKSGGLFSTANYVILGTIKQ